MEADRRGVEGDHACRRRRSDSGPSQAYQESCGHGDLDRWEPRSDPRWYTEAIEPGSSRWRRRAGDDFDDLQPSHCANQVRTGSRQRGDRDVRGTLHMKRVSTPTISCRLVTVNPTFS
jgi:hypothetical protein